MAPSPFKNQMALILSESRGLRWRLKRRLRHLGLIIRSEKSFAKLHDGGRPAMLIVDLDSLSVELDALADQLAKLPLPRPVCIGLLTEPTAASSRIFQEVGFDALLPREATKNQWNSALALILNGE